MAKSKSLGYQIHSALAEINLQDKEKRTDIFNKENETNYKSVGKREFKKNGTMVVAHVEEMGKVFVLLT